MAKPIKGQPIPKRKPRKAKPKPAAQNLNTPPLSFPGNLDLGELSTKVQFKDQELDGMEAQLNIEELLAERGYNETNPASGRAIVQAFKDWYEGRYHTQIEFTDAYLLAKQVEQVWLSIKKKLGL